MTTKAATHVRLQPSEFLNELETEHRAWLVPFDPQYLKNFDKLLKDSYEAAMMEAGVRHWLQSQGVSMEPSEDLATGQPRPDFLCVKDGQTFHVEVTHVSIQKATEKTGLPHLPDGKAQGYRSLNRAIWQACQGKARQCLDQQYPVLVAVGTYHYQASVLCISKPHMDMLLTGTTAITYNVNLSDDDDQTFDEDLHLSTKLDLAAFIKPDETEGVGFARSAIAGLLVCGTFEITPTVLCLLHPNPERTFDPLVLPDLPFAELAINRTTGRLSTRWSCLPEIEEVEFEEGDDGDEV